MIDEIKNYLRKKKRKEIKYKILSSSDHMFFNGDQIYLKAVVLYNMNYGVGSSTDDIQYCVQVGDEITNRLMVNKSDLVSIEDINVAINK